MSTYADQTEENKSESVASAVSQRQTSDEPTFEFMDSRPEAVAQRKLQHIADGSSQVSQLKSFQELADNSFPAKEVAQLQSRADAFSGQQHPTVQRQENNTGLPDNLKTGMENLSGMSLDHIKVHRNSDKPAAVQAHAYAQGSDIHLASGQEKHLPHELGHVVQQAEGRVKPTTSVNGMAVNDNVELEKEADSMGATAANYEANISEAFESKSLNSNSEIQLKLNPIQREYAPGIIVEPTELKQNAHIENADGPMPSKTFGSSHTGPKWKPGQIIPEVDFNIKSKGYYKTKYDGDDTWLDMTKVIKENLTLGGLENDDDSDADNAFARIGDTSDLVDGVAGGIENTWLKGVDGAGGIKSNLLKGSGEAEGGANGKFGDLKNKNTKVESVKNAGDFASGSLGALSSLWGMKNAAVDFYKDPGWKAFGEGAESLVSGVANGAKAVDGMAKALGHEKGTVKDGDTENNIGSDIVGKYTGAINDGVSSVKNAFIGFTGLWKLYNSPSNTKGKDALVSAKNITKAALDAAKVAKSAYDIIGKGIPTSLITTIPGLSIAVSAINLIIRFADAWQAGDVKNDMAEKSDRLRPIVSKSLGDADEKSANVFREDIRGIWPSYKTYYRIQPEILPAIDDAYAAGKTANTNQADESTAEAALVKNSKETFDAKVEALRANEDAKDSNTLESSKLENEAFSLLKANNGLVTDEYTSLHSQWQKALDKQEALDKQAAAASKEKETANSKMTSLPDEIVKDAAHNSLSASNLKQAAQTYLKGQITGKDTLENLKTTSDTIREYEVVDKMGEINQKRKVSGYTDVAKEMVNITADIVTLSGVGAAVGAAMKVTVAAESLAHAGAKGVQQIVRNNKTYGEGEINKSSNKKHQEYVSHTQHIFRMLSVGQTEDQANNVLAIIKATGVNSGMMFALNGEPAKQGEMMVTAMKKRD